MRTLIGLRQPPRVPQLGRRGDWPPCRSDSADRPDHPVVVEDRVQRHVVRLGLEVGHEACGESQAHRVGPRLQLGQRAVVEAAAVAQPVAARRRSPRRARTAAWARSPRCPWAWGCRRRPPPSGSRETRRGSVSVLCTLVDHRQADAARLRLVEQLAVFLPAVQRRQRVELALDRPVGADRRVSGRPTSQMRITRCSRSARCSRSGSPRRCSTRSLAQRDALSCRLVHNLPMKLRTILTLILAAFSPAPAQRPARPADDAILRDDSRPSRKTTRPGWRSCCRWPAAICSSPGPPTGSCAPGCDTATPQEVQDFLTRYAGTYQEDRLRNDWLLLLGQRRDWTAFAERPSDATA